MQWLAAAVLGGLLPWITWYLGERRPLLSRWAGFVGAAAFPFVLPPACPHVVQLFASALAVVWVMKSWERSHGGVCDPKLLWTRAGFALWWCIPPDVTLPGGPAQALANRKAGLLRLRRAFFEGLVFAATLAIRRAFPEFHAHPVGYLLWSMAMLYSFVVGLADLVTGLVMQAGYGVAEVFDLPILSRSPRDFWSRRWNRFVHDFALRHVYLPLGGRRRPGLAVAVVFGLSGLMHEYLIIAVGRGLGTHTGWTLAFFMVQGLGVMVHARVGDRLPRAAAIALHFAWMAATSPLFFLPLDEAAGFSQW